MCWLVVDVVSRRLAVFHFCFVLLLGHLLCLYIQSFSRRTTTQKRAAVNGDGRQGAAEQGLHCSGGGGWESNPGPVAWFII